MQLWCQTSGGPLRLRKKAKTLDIPCTFVAFLNIHSFFFSFHLGCNKVAKTFVLLSWHRKFGNRPMIYGFPYKLSPPPPPKNKNRARGCQFSGGDHRWSHVILGKLEWGCRNSGTVVPKIEGTDFFVITVRIMTAGLTKC